MPAGSAGRHTRLCEQVVPVFIEGLLDFFVGVGRARLSRTRTGVIISPDRVGVTASKGSTMRIVGPFVRLGGVRGFWAEVLTREEVPLPKKYVVKREGDGGEPDAAKYAPHRLSGKPGGSHPCAEHRAHGHRSVQRREGRPVHRQALDSGREPETCPVGAAF